MICLSPGTGLHHSSAQAALHGEAPLYDQNANQKAVTHAGN